MKPEYCKHCGAQLVDREISVGRHERFMMVFRVCPNAKYWEINGWIKHAGYRLTGDKLKEYIEEKKQKEEKEEDKRVT